MKPKNLSKKIRRMEVRLQKGAKKLAKLKQKLEAAVAASAAKKKRKSVARAGEVRKSRIQTAAVKRPSAVKKVKRKLDGPPRERRRTRLRKPLRPNQGLYRDRALSRSKAGAAARLHVRRFVAGARRRKFLHLHCDLFRLNI